jgi:tetratricopeptide (TPR) repeat protein
MLKDYNQSLAEFNPVPADGADKERYVKELGEIIISYANEAVKDLMNRKSYHPRISGSIAAGHILSIFGNHPQAMQFFDCALKIQELNYLHYYRSRLREVVEIMDNSNFPGKLSVQYKRRLKDLKRKKQSNKRLREKIIDIEADMECDAGDLDQILSRGKTERAKAYQKLGELEKAITLFEESMKNARDWRFENSVPNSLSIIDCYLGLNDFDKARQTFFDLIKKIAPETPKPGDALPEYILDNFDKLLPYIKKLGLEDSLDDLASFAKERLRVFHEQRKLENSRELRGTIELLVSYHVDRGEFKTASDLMDEARILANKEKYPSRFCLREQAEYLIRAGERERAEKLIEEDHAKIDSMGIDRDERIFELAALYLQLQKPDKALEMLQDHIEDYKRHGTQSLSETLETRREQIKILAKLIGKDYLERINQYMNMSEIKEDVFLLPEVIKEKR